MHSPGQLVSNSAMSHHRQSPCRMVCGHGFKQRWRIASDLGPLGVWLPCSRASLSLRDASQSSKESMKQTGLPQWSKKAIWILNVPVCDHQLLIVFFRGFMVTLHTFLTVYFGQDGCLFKACTVWTGPGLATGPPASFVKAATTFSTSLVAAPVLAWVLQEYGSMYSFEKKTNQKLKHKDPFLIYFTCWCDYYPNKNQTQETRMFSAFTLQNSPGCERLWTFTSCLAIFRKTRFHCFAPHLPQHLQRTLFFNFNNELFSWLTFELTQKPSRPQKKTTSMPRLSSEQ